MPEAPRTTPNYNWPTVDFASTATEQRNWKTQQIAAENAVDATVYLVEGKADAAQADATQALSDAAAAADVAAQAQTDASDALAAAEGAYIKTTDDATDIKLASLAGSSNGDVGFIIDNALGKGIVSGCEVTPNTTYPNTHFDVAAGVCFLSIGTDCGSAKGVFAVPATTEVAAITSLPTFIYAYYDAVSEGVLVGTTYDVNDFFGREDRVIIQAAFSDGTRLCLTGFGNDWQCIHSKLVARGVDEATGKGDQFVSRVSGMVLGTLATRRVTLSAGVAWGAYLKRKESIAFDTSGSDTFCSYNQVGAPDVWTHADVTQLNNTTWDNNGVPTALSNNYYKVVHMYIGWSGANLFGVESQAQYQTLVLAEAAPRPAYLPPVVAYFSMYVGRYILQQGTDTVLVRSPFTGVSGGSATTAHTGLTNLNTDPNYQHITLAEKTVLQNYIAGRDASGFIRKTTTGTFSIPIGSSAGAAYIYIDGVIQTAEAINYNAQIGLEVSPGLGAGSEHEGLMIYGTNDPTDWLDTMLYNAIDCVTSIEAVTSGTPGRIIFRVEWDTTTRPAALTVRYSLMVQGHAKQL